MGSPDHTSIFKESNKWITLNYVELKQTFNNEWIAVLNNAVLDHDMDLKTLVKRLKNQRPKEYNKIAVEYIKTEETDFSTQNDLWPES
jgi:hypothetical protein